MEYTDRDERAIAAHCEQELPVEVQVTILPPQKPPRWARQYTARPVGTRLACGNYVRLGGISE